VYGYNISRVAVYQGRFIVGRTHATLLLVRLRVHASTAAAHLKGV
jgi:hypothetical protein